VEVSVDFLNQLAETAFDETSYLIHEMEEASQFYLVMLFEERL
jgi:hypothetical protein